MALLQARDLTKTFGQVRALDAVSFDIDEGITGLLGSNGAGKSTSLKLFLGLLDPDGGTAEVLGVDPRTSPEYRTRVGYAPGARLPAASRLGGGVPRVHGADQRPAADRRAPARLRRAPARRPVRGALPRDGDVLDRDEAAREARAGARPRPRASRSSTSRPRASTPSAGARCSTSSGGSARSSGSASSSPRTSWATSSACATPSSCSTRGDCSARGRCRGSRRRPRRSRSSSSRASARVADGLRRRGLEPRVDGSRLTLERVSGADYDTLRDVIVESDALLYRLAPARHSLADVFVSEPPDAPDEEADAT